MTNIYNHRPVVQCDTQTRVEIMEPVVLLLVLLLLPFSASDQSSDEDHSGTYSKRRWGIRLGWHGTWGKEEAVGMV